jgi:hypothetical protein
MSNRASNSGSSPSGEYKPATPQQRRRIGAVALAVLALGIATSIVIMVVSGNVRVGLVALGAWGLVMIVIGVLFSAIELRRSSRT